MSRLIDADRLKEVFKRNTGYDYPDIIDKQPTAYDVDKVVEELRLASLDNIYHELAFFEIEPIVRKGGVE